MAFIEPMTHRSRRYTTLTTEPLSYNHRKTFSVRYRTLG